MRRSEGALTLAVSGDVDWDAVLRLEPEWEAAISCPTSRSTSPACVSSTGISLISTAVDRVRARGAAVRIVKPEPHVFRVFEVVGVHDMLPFVNLTDRG